MPLSITSPATDQAENRPGPVDTTSGTSGSTARIASAQRRGARRLIGRLAGVRRVSTTAPSGSGCSRAPCTRTRSSSSAASRRS